MFSLVGNVIRFYYDMNNNNQIIYSLLFNWKIAYRYSFFYFEVIFLKFSITFTILLLLLTL